MAQYYASTNAIAASAYSVDVTGTTKDLALTDAGTYQACSNGSAQTITILAEATVAFPIGTMITFGQEGAGLLTITGDTGVTVNGSSGGSVASNGQYTGMTLRKSASDTWIVLGGA